MVCILSFLYSVYIEKMNCKNDHDCFCFVCGEMVFKNQGLSVSTDSFVNLYQTKFNIDPRERNVQWSPSVSCRSCVRRLGDKNRPLNLVSPVKWNIPLEHPKDCYFCETHIPFGTRKVARKFIKYGNVASMVPAARAETGSTDDSESTTNFDAVNEPDDEPDNRTIPDDDTSLSIADDAFFAELFDQPAEQSHEQQVEQSTISQMDLDMLEAGPSRKVRKTVTREDHSAGQLSVPSTAISSMASSGDVYIPPETYVASEPKPVMHLTQSVFNDIVRDLDLSKLNAEILASRFQDIGIGQSKLNFYKN